MPDIHQNLNAVKCTCNNPECKIGIRSDTNPAVLLIQDKNGNDIAMHVTAQSLNDLIYFLTVFHKYVLRYENNE